MKKIALCFLTYKNLTQPKLWADIFNNYKDKLNVYIHNKFDFIDNEYGLHKYCIDKNNRVETMHAHKSLVKASLSLFKEAFIDESNDFFILLSDKCIPLYNFDYICNKIYEMNSNVIFNRLRENMERYNYLNDTTFFLEDEFSKDDQWFIIKRNTLKFVLKYDYLHLYSDYFYAVDEHYFGNIFNKFKISYINKQITYVNWKEISDSIYDRNYPKTYELLTNEVVDKIKTDYPDCLFMRKISDKCILPSYYDTI